MKKVLFHLIFKKETANLGEALKFDPTTSAGLRFLPALVLTFLIVGTGIVMILSFLSYTGDFSWR